MAEFDRLIAEAIEEMKKDSRYCDRGCTAMNGLGKCVGRAKADAGRPIVVFGTARIQQLADLNTGVIDEIPLGCPFFPPTAAEASPTSSDC